VLGFITGHGFLHGTQPRVLRKTLSETFQHISLIDLNGSQKRDNAGAVADESVFEIQTGVAIVLGRRSEASGITMSLQADIFGTFDMKAKWLAENSLASTKGDVHIPVAPNFFFRPMVEGATIEAEYNALPSVANFFGSGHPEVDKEVAWATGFATQQDDLAISFSRKDVQTKMVALREANTIQSLSEEYRVCSTNQWNFAQANEWAATDSWKSELCKVDYRPFDQRLSVFNKHVMTIRRREVMQHLGRADSLALVCSRAVNDHDFRHVFVCREKVDKIFLSGKSSTNAYVFPLWRFSTSGIPKANISKSIVRRLQAAIDTESESRSSAPLTEQSVFLYLYSVLHSPAYRSRYASFLRIDFPRIPIPGSREVFDALAELGAELVAWHLLEHPDAAAIDVNHSTPAGTLTWFGRDFALNKVAEKSRELADMQGTEDKVGKVFINATSGFANVHQSIWQHTIGGYQVLHKWLDDRRKAGRSLSQDDIIHWLRVYAALQATQKLMVQVDVAIEANGGWPGAFSQDHPPPDAATLAAEQMAQKEQLKAQKKATSAAKKSAVQASPTGATSLFDDLEDMARAAGGPDHPKPRATPAKAAGGKASGGAVQVNGLNDGLLMCAIRRVLASAGIDGLSRNDLIRSIARELGHARTSPALKVELDSAIRRAVRRGIAENSGGVLTLLVKDIDGYDREHLKAQLLMAIRAVGGNCPKEDAPKLLARALGFARTGPGITSIVDVILRSLIRAKLVESKSGQIRTLRLSDA
jgi:hypothetical protein